MQIGMEHVRHLAQQRGALQRRLDGIRDRMAGTTERVVRTATVGLASLAGGVISGRAGEKHATIFHIPVDLGLAAVLGGLGYFGAAGKQSHHLVNAGDGFLASFLNGVGFSWGNSWRQSGRLWGGGHPSALPGPGTASSGELSPADMANIVARVRAASAIPG